MNQQHLFDPPPAVWDAINHKPEDNSRQRALDGLPHYWRITWGYDDVLIFRCGHAGRFRVSDIEDPGFKPKCPYIQWGGCTGKTIDKKATL